jgi:hypothetical protein
MAIPTIHLVRQFAFALLAVAGALHTPVHSQARDGAARPKPCAWLTAEIVKKVSVANHKSGALPAPAELPLPSGVACEWGDVVLQIDPFPPTQLDKLRLTDTKNWESVSGVGDAAYFHNVQNAVGELFVRVGARTFGLLITIPVGTTAAAFKPNFIAVANQIVPKLR